MKVIDAPLAGVKVIEPRIFRDDRGHFLEMWNAARYADAGVDRPFVQDNVSVSRRGVIRGLHYQHPHAQAKLVSVVDGEIWDVAVDVRRGSSTFGRWYGVNLSGENGRQLYIPEGFAHGFAVTSERAVVSYKCTDYHDPSSERSVLWDDPDLGIDWPVQEPVLSEKDRQGTRFREMEPAALPVLSTAEG